MRNHACFSICRLFSLPILFTMIGACASQQTNWLDETATNYAGGDAPPGSVVCRNEYPTGSGIRTRVCHRVPTDTELLEDRANALDHLKGLGGLEVPRLPGPRPVQENR